MSDEQTAWHESGHAIVAAILGGTVHSVSIDMEDDSQAGGTKVEWPVAGLTAQENALREIRVSLAGPVAEMIYAGDYDELRIQSEHEMDWQTATLHVRQLAREPAKQHEILGRIVNELYRLLRQDNTHAAIGDLADQLLAHDSVEFETVEKIVRQWLS